MNTLEANKAVILRYVDAFNRADFEALKNIFTPEAEIQGVLGKGHVDKVIGIWRELLTAFGIQLAVEEIIAENERVAVRYTERGTFKSAFRGQAPTGKSYELTAIEWFEVRGGKIQRRWGVRDAASQARQLGIPAS